MHDEIDALLDEHGRWSAAAREHATAAEAALLARATELAAT